MKVILFDTEENVKNLLPLSFTRPVSLFRVGITTILEKWQMLLPGEYTLYPVEYLREVFTPGGLPDGDDFLFVAGNVIPDADAARSVGSLAYGDSLSSEGRLVAYRGSQEGFEALGEAAPEDAMELPGCRRVEYVFDIFRANYQALTEDFHRLTAGRRSQPLSESNRLIGGHTDSDGNPTVFIEEGAVVEGAILNVKDGPIYIGADAEIMEGASLRGPVALCKGAKVKMGGRIYGATTLGPYCKVGGELSNVVMFGYSNKAHDGYLGNAVIGEWCNIGAGVNASNLKNDYSKIRIWNYSTRRFMRTDLQFCGLIMGDHSKAGVNCMFNTATVLGVGVNIHGSGFPRTFIPSFSEGSPVGGFKDVSLSKFLEIAERVMSRRGIAVSEGDRRIYEHVYEVSQKFK